MSTLKVPVFKEFGWTPENAEKKISYISIAHNNEDIKISRLQAC